MVARAGHPWPVPGRAHVVVEEALPGLDRRVADVGIAQVAVQQVEQGVGSLDSIDDEAGIGRPRAKAEADRHGHRLVPEAGEAELPGPSLRPGAELARKGIRSPVVDLVDVVGVRLEAVHPGVIGVDRLTGEGLGVDPLDCVDLGAVAVAGDHLGARHPGRARRHVPAPQHNCLWRAARASREG